MKYDLSLKKKKPLITKNENKKDKSKKWGTFSSTKMPISSKYGDFCTGIF